MASHKTSNRGERKMKGIRCTNYIKDVGCVACYGHSYDDDCKGHRMTCLRYFKKERIEIFTVEQRLLENKRRKYIKKYNSRKDSLRYKSRNKLRHAVYLGEIWKFI